jgi:hypothetical protein
VVAGLVVVAVLRTPGAATDPGVKNPGVKNPRTSSTGRKTASMLLRPRFVMRRG